MDSIKRFLLEEDGATAVEYGIMVAAIAAVIVAIVFSIGTQVNTAFTTVDGAMATGTGGTGGTTP